MLKQILHKDVQAYINKNLDTDITRLILKGSPFKDVPVRELANQIEAKKKCKKKLPTWFATENIYYPAKINIEQTSSEIAAKYKSSIMEGESLIDLTGGLGIDAFYFSKTFNKVTHCEINTDLASIASYNFNVLNANNIISISENGFDYLKKTTKKYDCIYIDPSRRNELKGKVFLLKDCLPIVPPKIDFFFSKSNQILIKVSPILDITSTIKELKNVKEIHIVAIDNEVKEVLYLLEKEYNNQITIITKNISKKKVESFTTEFGKFAEASFSEPKKYLYEPNTAILKSGAFSELASFYKIAKLHPNSHLYTSEEKIDFPGRTFLIENVVLYEKKELKKLCPNKKANITIRNFPKSVSQIRKETKIKDGGSVYIFCTTNSKNKLLTIKCSKIS